MVFRLQFWPLSKPLKLFFYDIYHLNVRNSIMSLLIAISQGCQKQWPLSAMLSFWEGLILRFWPKSLTF